MEGKDSSTTGPVPLQRRLSPLAYLVLRHHHARPDFAMYDIAALGTRQPSSRQLDQLAKAYEELERAHLVERSNEVERYRDRFFYLYKPPSTGRVEAGTER